MQSSNIKLSFYFQFRNKTLTYILVIAAILVSVAISCKKPRRRCPTPGNINYYLLLINYGMCGVAKGIRRVSFFIIYCLQTTGSEGALNYISRFVWKDVK